MRNSREEKNHDKQMEIVKEEIQKKAKKVIKILTTIIIIITIIISYSMFIEPKNFIVYERKITNKKIPEVFHGTKLVQISDILYDSIEEKELNKIKDKVNLLKPDILVFTGNIKKYNYKLNKEDIELLTNFFKNMNCKYKYAIQGSQDDESFKVIMEDSNFKILKQESDLIFNKNSTPIEILGLDDNIEKKDDYYTICIMHNPDIIKNIKICDLALAGDSLGGQVRLPFIGGLAKNNKYVNKYYKVNNTDLYVSNGLGSSHRIRFLNYPSISLFRLTTH